MLDYFSALQQRVLQPVHPVAIGHITRVVGMTLEARGLYVPVGTRCLVSHSIHNKKDFEVEVVGFDGAKTFLMPLRAIDTLSPGARVTPINTSMQVPTGHGLLGRVLNGIGEPIDGKGSLKTDEYTSFHPSAINPLQRSPIKFPLDIGVRSINAALSVGCGQRIGLFAGSGVGKSVLLGMMTRFTEADVVIVALVGERGREVREFVENILGVAGMEKAIVVASPADDTPVMRLKAGMYAARLSEYFRDSGKKTLLLFDSLTRYAQAQREIALATGEPPATRGYPPSVFSLLPQLVERAGNGSAGGSVTAFYTVLTEGDDVNDPVADAARAILDGHIVLSRALASEGIYPAIDIQASISRAMNQIVSEQQVQYSNQLKQWIARYTESRDLISVGAYTAGVDVLTDAAIAKQPAIKQFLTQSLSSAVSYVESVAELEKLVTEESGVQSTPDLVQENGLAITADVQNSDATSIAGATASQVVS